MVTRRRFTADFKARVALEGCCHGNWLVSAAGGE